MVGEGRQDTNGTIEAHSEMFQAFCDYCDVEVKGQWWTQCGMNLCRRCYQALAAPSAEEKRPRIWVLHSVVILRMKTWKRLCQEIPALGAMHFEVGCESDEG